MVLRINSGKPPSINGANPDGGAAPSLMNGLLKPGGAAPSKMNGMDAPGGAAPSLMNGLLKYGGINDPNTIAANQAKANDFYGPSSLDTSANNPWNRSANTPYEYIPDPNYQAPAEPPVADPGFQGKWADYLAMATKTAGSGIANQLAALAATKDQMNQGYQVGDQQLAAMYQALQAQTQQDKASVAQRYQEAQAQAQQSSQQSQAALTGANQSITGEQNASQANLNNQQVDPNGGLTVAQRAQLEAQKLNNAQLQQQGQSQYQSLQNTGNAQQDYMGTMGTAAQFAGADRRSALKNALLQGLLGIGQQEAQLKDSQGTVANSLASTMYNNDYNAYKDNRDYQLKMDDAAWQRAYQQQLADNGKTTADAALARSQGSASTQASPDAAVAFLQGPGGMDANTANGIINTVLDGISNYQGTTVGGGSALTSYQAGMKAINDAVAAGTIPPEQKGAAVAALYKMTGSF